MKTFLSALGAGVLAVALGAAGPAAAAESGHAGGEQAAHASKPLLENEMGHHVMVGTITRIDHRKGTLSVDTGIAPLDLHFPPPAIAKLKMGDRVAVELGISTTIPSQGEKMGGHGAE